MGDNDYYAVSVYNIKWEDIILGCTPKYRLFLFKLSITYGKTLRTEILLKKYKKKYFFPFQMNLFLFKGHP